MNISAPFIRRPVTSVHGSTSGSALLFSDSFSSMPLLFLSAIVAIYIVLGILYENAIMMVDFAIAAKRDHNASSRDAIYEACMLRLRPILMTTCAAMLGAAPLAISFGEGGEIRRPLGVAIVGGLLVSQILTLYTTPVIYLYLDRFGLWVDAKRRRLFAPRRSGAAAAPTTP